MRKSELKLKTMRRKLSIESSDLDAWLFSFGISQPRSAWVAWLYLPFLSLFAIALHLFMVARVEV